MWGPAGWAELSVTEDDIANNVPFEHYYEITSEQLRKSVQESCWWCEYLVDAILRTDSGDFRHDRYEIERLIESPKRRVPPRLGLFCNAIRALDNKGDIKWVCSFYCGVFAKPGKPITTSVVIVVVTYSRLTIWCL